MALICAIISVAVLSQGSMPVVLPSFQPPGGFASNQVPQIVLITFDDAVTTASYKRVTEILDGHSNPNGDGIKATFFVSLDGSIEYDRVNALYAAGHEIAIHTMTHGTDTNTTLAAFRKEIVGCRKTLARLAAVPESEMVGFRAPYLQFSKNSFDILSEQGFLYDSNLQEWPGSASSSNSTYIWPYTLESDTPQTNWTGSFPIGEHPGLFEIHCIHKLLQMEH